MRFSKDENDSMGKFLCVAEFGHKQTIWNHAEKNCRRFWKSGYY